VIKPLDGFNAIGVILVKDNQDIFTGRSIRGRQDVASLYQAKISKKNAAIAAGTVYAERLLEAADWPGSNQLQREAPADFKFFTFGSKIATCLIVLHRKTPRECMLWVDENFNRQDQHGCTWYNPKTGKDIRDFAELQRSHHLWKKCGHIPEPPNWPKLVSTARLLGGALGVHYRVDLFDSKGGVLLGEFTPFPALAKVQCVVVRNSSGVLDPCTLGRMWKHEGLDDSSHAVVQRMKQNHPPEMLLRYFQMLERGLFKNDINRTNFEQSHLCKLAMLSKRDFEEARQAESNAPNQQLAAKNETAQQQKTY